MKPGPRLYAERRPRRADAEAGFTMVELVASLTVLVIGIVGVIGVMNGSFRVAVNASQRSKAVAVATKHIEELRARRYENIATTGQTENLPAENVDGRKFEVKRTVVMVNEATPPPTTQGQPAQAPTTNAYKKAIIEVRWQEIDGWKFLHQETLLYPGGKGTFTPVVPAAPVSGKPLAPSTLIATIPTDLIGTTGVDLRWTPPPESNAAPAPVSYVVQYATDVNFSTFQEVTDTVPAVNPALRISDLAASTLYHFRVFSKASNGEVSAGAATKFDVLTSASASLTCVIGEANVTPDAMKKRPNGRLVADMRVSVNGVGTCLQTRLRIEYIPMNDGVKVIEPVGGKLPVGAIWTFTVRGTNQTWTVGEHLIEVYDASDVKRATLKVTICDSKKLRCP